MGARLYALADSRHSLAAVLLCALCAFALPATGCAARMERGLAIPLKCIQDIRFLKACAPVSANQCDVKARVTFACVEYPETKP